MSSAPSESPAFTISLEQERDFEFRVKFDWPGNADLLLDEPEPLGHRRGPNAARMIAAGVANCLSASLLFCLRTKFKQNPGPLRATATGRLERNERGRYRIAAIDVAITLADEAQALPHLERCAGQFEDFCIVAESVRHGIPVNVTVRDAAGHTIHESGGAAEAKAAR
jgi:organic hydroperoxide reductase OsmC/OhrA